MAQYLAPEQLELASGVPLNGGKKHVYQTGTTTNLSLYSDEGLSTPAANPIPADASGAFAGVFLAETECKQIITTAADVTVYTRAVVYTVGVSNIIDADDVSYDGTASGLSSETVQDAIDEVVDLQGLTQNWESSANGVIATGTSTNTGAAGGPDLDLYRNSASPAASDVIGGVRFSGENASDSKEIYAKVHGVIVDATNGSEDGKVVVQTMVAGALADRVHVGAGIWGAGATGGDPGVGKANFTAVNINGTQMPFSKGFESAEQAVGSSSEQYTMAHSLGATPKLITAVLRCKTTDAGWAVGDEIAYVNEDSSGVTAFSIGADATNVYISQSGGPRLCNKGTSAVTSMTVANWRWVARAWA